MYVFKKLGYNVIIMIKIIIDWRINMNAGFGFPVVSMIGDFSIKANQIFLNIYCSFFNSI